MSFSDNHIIIPNPLTTGANSIAEEGTTSGAGKIEYVAPVHMDVEEFGVLISVTMGNTITTATGLALCRVQGTVEEVLEILKLSNNPKGLYAGDGVHPGGGTVAAATTVAYAPGDIIKKHMSSHHHFPAGSIIRFRGTTTVGSATGDFVPFVICRVAGKDFKPTNVYNEGRLTREYYDRG